MTMTRTLGTFSRNAAHVSTKGSEIRSQINSVKEVLFKTFGGYETRIQIP